MGRGWRVPWPGTTTGYAEGRAVAYGATGLVLVLVLMLAACVADGPGGTGGSGGSGSGGSGDVGWRLLGEEQGAGEARRTGVATTQRQLGPLWQEAGLPGDPGAVDWDQEIVIWFGAVYGSGCPVEFRGAVVDGATVHGDIDIIGTPPGCNDDANPHAFVVAVDRADLPAGPFTVQLGGGEPYLGDPGEEGEATVVEVDLSAAGATAADGELRHDPAPEPQPGPLLVDGDGMPDDGDRYVWHPRPECPGTVMGPLDNTLWQLDDGEAAWAEVDGQELTFHPAGRDILIASSPGMDYAFVPAPEDVCG